MNDVTVTPYDHPLRFLVQSSERADIEHLVDLAGGQLYQGECSCESYQFRNKPAGNRCKHIHAAREFFCNSSIASIMTAEPQPNDQDHDNR